MTRVGVTPQFPEMIEGRCYSSRGEQKVGYTVHKVSMIYCLVLVKHFCVLLRSVGSGTPASLPHSSATVPPTEVTSQPALFFTATAIIVFGVASLTHFFI